MSHHTVAAEPGRRPGTADFLAVNRGGGLFSEALSQRIGAAFSLAAHRLGLAPSVLTIVGVTIGLGSSVALVLLSPMAAAGDVAPWVVGLFVGVGWQIAYAFDCSDGMLARVTGQTSTAGARLDILCDVATQISVVTAISAAAAAHAPATPAWLYPLFAGTWMVNLVTSALASGAAGGSLVQSSSTLVRVVKLVRDYGAVIAVCALVITLLPRQTPWLMAAFSAVNGLFLLASIGQSAIASLRPGAKH
ncbi:MAG TPA: CDP-alcohol phosphatidyltransferase family protein [Micromonosporaceae bacterium]|nr:CDP-alcohol phosphatidyltransferase family protein [Micromonosporaceae bacterium]